MNHIYGVTYVVTNTNNGRRYVGQTTGLPWVRWISHLQTSTKGRGFLLGAALRKHGLTAFTFEVVEECYTKADLDESERRLIRELKSLAPNGYNLREGGHRAKISSEELRRRTQTLRATYAATDLAERARRRALLLHSDPDFKERHREAVSAACSSEIFRAKKSRSSILMHRKPENKKKHHDRLVAALADEDVRRRMGAGISAARARPETREKYEAYWDEEKRSVLGQKMRVVLSSPAVKEKMRRNVLGRIWINNGMSSRRLRPVGEIPAGWVRGRLPFARRVAA